MALIDPAKEFETLLGELNPKIQQGDIALTLLPQPCTLAAIASALMQDRYHILHLICHGQYSEISQQTRLLLANDENRVLAVTDQDVMDTLSQQLDSTDIHDEDRLRMIFLASCETASRSSADAFRGLAPLLVQAGVPSVVAMQDQVGIETARRFGATFYQRLIEHGQVDRATNEARHIIMASNLTGAVIPVLFLRLRNGQLFSTKSDRYVPLPFEPEIVDIPAGQFLMGSKPGDGVPAHELPQHPVDLPAYRIGKYPVTNREYAEFVQQTNQHVSPVMGWNGNDPPDEKLEHPVSGVTFYDAIAYCKWLSAQTERTYRLPTEAEWEKAARGPGDEGNIYPWGYEWEENRCHNEATASASVKAYPAQSDYGCYDMVGNVREWTCSLWGDKYTAPDEQFAYHWKPDSRNDIQASRSIRRAVRGRITQ